MLFEAGPVGFFKVNESRGEAGVRGVVGKVGKRDAYGEMVAVKASKGGPSKSGKEVVGDDRYVRRRRLLVEGKRDASRGVNVEDSEAAVFNSIIYVITAKFF